MKFSGMTERLADLGSAKWALHYKARAMKAAGEEILEFTIGEPDTPTPENLQRIAAEAIAAGRTGYSNGRGEPALLAALAGRYSDRLGRTIGKDQFLCLPGTQSALFVALMSITDPGDEVIVGDPMYATYQGIIAASGAVRVPVKLRPEMGFRLQASDVAALITPRTRAIFLNSPHNPTGAMLTPEDIRALGDLAKKHDLWIISDEVYEDLVFPGQSFTSPFLFEDLADRVIVACSISKSHAAAGFRSGWCMGTPETIARMLPVAETMLFGNQPFIADMTAAALSAPSPVAAGMVARFARRSEAVFQMLDGVAGLAVHRPQAGMFAVIDVRGTGLDSVSFAERLLESQHVAVMPGLSFGDTFGGWIRFSLSRPDADINEACARMARFSQSLREAAE